jgi:regulator of sirC expression with transglutaminase-like and TPR domain
MPSARVQEFAAIVQRPEAEIELDRAALLVGAWDYDRIDIAHYRATLDAIAESALRRRRDLRDLPAPTVRALAEVLFDDLGFHGNTTDYYDPRNSFLHEVIDRRTGIPISLSVLYIEIARRMGVPAAGIGFPGHFLVRIEDGEPLILDPFRGGAPLGHGELEALLRRTAGADAKLEPDLLKPASKPQILTRMLVNLAGIYGRDGDLDRSLEVLERLHLLDAENPRILRELEQLRHRVDTLN